MDSFLKEILCWQEIKLIYVIYIILFSSYQSNYGTFMVLAFSNTKHSIFLVLKMLTGVM